MLVVVAAPPFRIGEVLVLPRPALSTVGQQIHRLSVLQYGALCLHAHAASCPSALCTLASPATVSSL
ncbi:hypothetical protein ACFPRL_07830 [Pseudoclavibacter helvolus]